MIHLTKGFATAVSRWARLGPYYGIFPVEFAFHVINTYSKVGDSILDPFAGRGSSVFAGSVLGRQSTGIEINPVGWIYGQVKLSPAPKELVLLRLADIDSKKEDYRSQLKDLPEFYHMAYCPAVLKFLLCARAQLDWKGSNPDRTLMAVILTYLHAKIGDGLSNQMRGVKSVGMRYAIQWWRANGYTTPPELNAKDLLEKRICWRYQKGRPVATPSEVILGDSTKELKRLANRKYQLLFTSPPYCGVTDYHADQWLRLWLLGGSAVPSTNQAKHKSRFTDRLEYYYLLSEVFQRSAELMDERSTIYVRTDKRPYTFNTTLNSLKFHFKSHSVKIVQRPLGQNTKTQTQLYGDKKMKPGEVDIILTNQ